MSYRPTSLRILGGSAFVLLAGLISAQSGGGYDLSWSTIDGGGATELSGGEYTMGVTIGQPDAGETMFGDGGISLTGGFWAVTIEADSPTPCPDRGMDTLPQPSQVIDVDGDGYNDEIETELASNPGNAGAWPICLGNFNGDGQTDIEDAMILFRVAEASGGTVTPYDPYLDLNLDGAVTTDDAVLLFEWSVNEPGSQVIPMALPPRGEE